jgi:hypothetical protein
MELHMTTTKTPSVPSKQMLALSAKRLMRENVLGKGGPQPSSPKVIEVASRILANKVHRESTQRLKKAH